MERYILVEPVKDGYDFYDVFDTVKNETVVSISNRLRCADIIAQSAFATIHEVENDG